MAQSKELQELIEGLQTSTYVPKSQEELQQKAQNRYQSVYDQKRLSAQQEYERNAAALDKQLAGLGAAYDKQREESAKSYAQAYSQADRNLLSKGMQRSSYGAQVLSNVQLEGAEAQQEISDQEAAKRLGLEDEQALLAQQLAAQLKSYDAQQAADILAYMEELEQQEYDREQQAIQYQNNLSMQIYEYLMGEKQAETEQSRWQSEFDLALKQYEDNKKKSSGGGSYNNGGTSTKNQTPPVSDDDLYKMLDDAFGGSGDADVDVTTGAAPTAGAAPKASEDITEQLKDVSEKKIVKKGDAKSNGYVYLRTY